MHRRQFVSLMVGSAFVSRTVRAQPSRVALYASVGRELTHYDVDVDGATLTRRDSVLVRDPVQYAWPHALHRHLYVASSNGGPGGTRITPVPFASTETAAP